jgi:hypothetical protein
MTVPRVEVGAEKNKENSRLLSGPIDFESFNKDPGKLTQLQRDQVNLALDRKETKTFEELDAQKGVSKKLWGLRAQIQRGMLENGMKLVA